MLIGIDASRATVEKRTGVEGYSINVIQHLLQVGREHRFRLYFRDEPPPDLFAPSAQVEIEVIRRPRLWTHTGLGFAVRRDPPDVLFVPGHVMPWPDIGGVPGVVTVHDLGYRHFPEKHPLLDRLYLNWSTRHSARQSRRVLAVSQATAHDLITLDGVPAEKVRVVHPGVDDMLRPIRDEKRIAMVKAKLGISGPYMLHVGSLRPRKNLLALVEAFNRVKDTVPGLMLVLAGSRSRGFRRLVARVKALGLGGRVRFPGYVADADLPSLYSGALAYAFPTLYEGFGFPVLEAMACDTAVACANTSSLPELVGDAALTFAPTDIYGLSRALERLLTDEALRCTLIERGRERVAKFTWEQCARESLTIIEEAASGV